MYAARTDANETSRSAKAGLAFQAPQMAGTTTKQPSTNRWPTVAPTVSPSTWTDGTTPPTKSRPRTRPSPRLWSARKATATQRMRFGSLRMKGPSSNDHNPGNQGQSSFPQLGGRSPDVRDGSRHAGRVDVTAICPVACLVRAEGPYDNLPDRAVEVRRGGLSRGSAQIVVVVDEPVVRRGVVCD